MGKQGQGWFVESQLNSFLVVIAAFFCLAAFSSHHLLMQTLCLPCYLQGVYVFYLQLLTDMLHLCVYLVFFVIVFTNYGLPLHLVSLLLLPSLYCTVLCVDCRHVQICTLSMLS